MLSGSKGFHLLDLLILFAYAGLFRCYCHYWAWTIIPSEELRPAPGWKQRLSAQTRPHLSAFSRPRQLIYFFLLWFPTAFHLAEKMKFGIGHKMYSLTLQQLQKSCLNNGFISPANTFSSNCWKKMKLQKGFLWEMLYFWSHKELSWDQHS